MAAGSTGLRTRRAPAGRNGAARRRCVCFSAPTRKTATAWAPATVANLGPGFDWMGCAVNGEGDTVTATALPDCPGEVKIASIKGDGGRLPLDPATNCIGIAAAETLKLLGVTDTGVELQLNKGLPLGSGMGSSAASAAAACWSVNVLFGEPLSKVDLIAAGLKSEATVSGMHADNIAPALLGGFVLVRSAEPLDVQPLLFPATDLLFVLVNPKFEAPTREMRAALPSSVPFSSMIKNSVAGGSLVAAILSGDTELLGQSLNSEVVVEAARGPLIPGFQAAKQAALEAGAWGCTISGAGPTVVAVTNNEQQGARIGQSISNAFGAAGLETNSIQVVGLDKVGARTVASV